MPRFSKKRNDQYAKELNALLVELGAERTSHWGYGYELQTEVGPLRLRADPNVAQEGATVFACFDEPALAVTLLGEGWAGGVNSYSGKWNHFFFGTASEFPGWKAGLRRQLEKAIGGNMQRNAGRPSRSVRDYPKAGFAITLSNQQSIEERAAELFGPRGEDPEAREEFIAEGLLDRQGEITEQGWAQLGDDLDQIETNVMRWLHSTFQGAEDHGHDNDDLVGWVWFNPRSKRQNLREAEDRVGIDDMMEGRVFIAWKGVSRLGTFLLNGDVFFEDVEGRR